MTEPSPHDITQMLSDWSKGDREALDRLIPVVYTELRRRAANHLRRERPGHTLQPTALIHEAYVRLVDQKNVRWQNRAHFFAVAAQLMRRVLVDHARRRGRAKRGGSAIKLPFEEGLVLMANPAFRYKGREIDPQTVGRELNVRAVLMGRVRQTEDRLNIQVDFVDATTGAQLWGKEYERKISDVLAVKQTIAREITEKLRLRLSGEEQQRLVRSDTTSTEAYQFYLRGRFHWNKRTVKELRKSIEYFHQAVTVDPNYALGYAGLADAYIQFSQISDTPSREVLPKAKGAAMRALSLDDGLAEAHAALGLLIILLRLRLCRGGTRAETGD